MVAQEDARIDARIRAGLRRAGRQELLGCRRLTIFGRPRAGGWLAHEIADWKTSGLTGIVSLLEAFAVRETGRAGGSPGRELNVSDPRAAVGGAIWSWMIYGAKGVRYVVSADYRARVQAFCRLHPDRRAGGIRRMIWGAVLDMLLVVRGMHVKLN